MNRVQGKLVKIIICTLLLICALGWVSSSQVLLPFFAGCADQTVVEDIDQDGNPKSYVLHNRRLSVYENNQLLWQSAEDWMVQSFVLADVNHDAVDDLLMVVWKRGSFGPNKPFWVLKDDLRFSNHLFLYNQQQDRMKPLWMSSALDRPIKTLKIADPNNDGKNELLVQEGSYSIYGWIKAAYTSPEFEVWQWKGWGFYRLD
jgi:hypothetical protein